MLTLRLSERRGEGSTAAWGRRSSGRGQLRRRGVVDGDGGGSGDTSEVEGAEEGYGRMDG